MEHLYDKLTEYSCQDVYPYHMPGHKRRLNGDMPQDVFAMDITEIDGFDNLHDPQDIIKNIQESVSKMYGAEESYIMVNGSTGGILSAISAAVPVGGHILMSRNCHKSAYNALYLRNVRATYIYPKMCRGFDFFDGLTLEDVKLCVEKCEKQKDKINAVLIVSPTYEGRVSDVKNIAKYLHEKGIPLIVDEAHGAHLGLEEHVEKNSCQLGADIVIHSVHKTLPAMTQTALIHVNGNFINRDLLRRFLHIYQSSSPSYVLIASVENALDIVKNQGRNLFATFADEYKKMLFELKKCEKLQFIFSDVSGLKSEKNTNDFYPRQDIGKLVISTKGTNISGKELYNILRDRYHLQLEMACESYCLAMFTIADDASGYHRMTKALLEIDSEIKIESNKDRINANVKAAEIKLPMSEAWNSESELVYIEEAVGRISGDFVNLYPPGIPVLVPGELISKEIADSIRTYHEKGLNVQGISLEKGRIYMYVI